MQSPIDLQEVADKIISLVATRPLEAPYLLRASATAERFQLEARPLQSVGPWLEGSLLPYVRKKPEAKSLDDQLYEHVKKLNNSVEEALLLGPEGELGEAATSNLIFAKEDVLIVPETNVLPGITLAKLLPSLADRFTIERREAQLTDLIDVTEILATGSGKEVVGFARIPEIGWRARSEHVLQTARELYAAIKNSHLASLDA
jgi:branched-subunit amino acid aminotransferase/4-amino-4-deoxychorismate lyase